MKRIRLFVILAVSLLSCNLPAAVPATSQAVPTKTPFFENRTPITNHVPPSLDVRPLVWFAPLPPLPVVTGRLFTGSDDFMQLFTADAPWQTAAGYVHVFKLYGEWVGYASDAQLKQAVQDAERRGFDLAMEFGPLDAEDCGEGIEGFSGVSYAVSTAKRIRSVGGTLDLLAMDEPYFYGHIYDGPKACHWSPEKIAQEIDQFIGAMKNVFPDIMVGDTEALAGAAGASQYNAWMDTFRQVNGYDLAFLHMDIDWSRTHWDDEVIAIQNHGRGMNVPIGVIYTGNGFDATDEDWLSAAGERVKKLELEKGSVPDHILFQSWNDKPDHVLPETTDFTFTNFILDYFTDKSSLGYRREGKGANLALSKTTRVSAFTSDQSGSLAVDGDLGTLWNSGGGPAQWIEIDLGGAYNILEVKMAVSQFPEGRTVHNLLGAGSDRNFAQLAVFDGSTRDGEVLSYSPDDPINEIQFIRVETSVSPSWVAWREIEVIDAGK